ncbi:transcriptional regulator [Lysinibacillus cavernae]|uniref:transcriptional regulator n=1 Tax=Lysinibacillus cavernae TaxID=2666135 RepID=UPI0012D904D3|nr:transcriptional regulator [Lysinibacillus cavernae]
MRKQLIKEMRRSKNGSVTKRQIKVIKIVGDSLQAFCYMRQTKLTFLISHALSAVPVIYKQRGVV